MGLSPRVSTFFFTFVMILLSPLYLMEGKCCQQLMKIYNSNRDLTLKVEISPDFEYMYYYYYYFLVNMRLTGIAITVAVTLAELSQLGLGCRGIMCPHMSYWRTLLLLILILFSILHGCSSIL